MKFTQTLLTVCALFTSVHAFAVGSTAIAISSTHQNHSAKQIRDKVLSNEDMVNHILPFLSDPDLLAFQQNHYLRSEIVSTLQKKMPIQDWKDGPGEGKVVQNDFHNRSFWIAFDLFSQCLNFKSTAAP